jgi:hypothetical protein
VLLLTADDTALQGSDTVQIIVEAAPPVHAYWKMDEGAPSTTIADTVPPDNGTGTINGATWTTGISGAALDFDGTDDFVAIEDSPSLRITGTEISLHAWVFPQCGGGTNGCRIISKSQDDFNSEVYALSINDYRVVFRIDGQDVVSSHIVVLNEWVHVGAVYNGSDVRIYINGELDAATPVAKTDPIDDSTRPVRLGAQEIRGRHFNGIIDEVQIFDSAVIPPVVLTPARGAGLFFEDITLDANTSGPSDGGHGVAFADVDDDTRPDYYLTNSLEGFGNRPDYFFDNTNGNSFAELAAARGIADTDGGSHGAVWADLDNDGDYDLVNGTTWDSLNPSAGNPDNDNVFRNDGPATPFVDVTGTIPDIQNKEIETRGITAFDMDSDGDLDIFAVPGLGATLGDNAAFLNNGGLSFSSHAGGVLSTAFAMEGITDTDYDGDGDIDILAANFFGDIVILQNQTAPPASNPGVFIQQSPGLLGITDSASTGITTGDVDNDGDLDLLLVDRGNAYLYHRENDGTYTREQSFSDVGGFMGGFADLDNDDDLDLVFAGDEKVYLGSNSGRFSMGQSVPVSGILEPRAIAFADIDNDGDLDFAITAKDSRNWLVRNDLDLGPRNWLKVKLVSPQCQAGAFGAKVKVSSGAFQMMREAKGNYGYLAQDDPVLHFGLASFPSVNVVVEWTDGSTTSISGVAPNQTLPIDGGCPP